MTTNEKLEIHYVHCSTVLKVQVVVALERDSNGERISLLYVFFFSTNTMSGFAALLGAQFAHFL